MQWGGAHSSYCHGLGPNICAVMSVYNDMIGLENFMQKVTCISQRLLACQPNKAACQLVSPTISLPVPESMRLDSIHLTHAKRALRIAAVLCLYCAATDHFIQNCPVRPPRPAVSTLQLEPDFPRYLCYQYNYSPLITLLQSLPLLTLAPRAILYPKTS